MAYDMAAALRGEATTTAARGRASNSIQWRGWQAIDDDKGDGGGDGDNVGDGDGDEAGGRRRGQG